MKMFIKSMIYFFVICIANSNLYSEVTWKEILIEKDIWNSDIYLMNSFDKDHLVAIQYAQISHIYLNEKKAVNLIEFTDWNVGLKNISFSSTENMVFYGILNQTHPDNPLLYIYKNIFLIVNKDSAFNYNENKWIINVYPESIPEIAYSNVDENGNGMSVSNKNMQTYVYNNWQENMIYSDTAKYAVCGTYCDKSHYIIIERYYHTYILLKTSNGVTWDSLGRINKSQSFSQNEIKKLIVQNENDIYMITSDGFYFSNNKGLEGTWRYKKITTPGINDAIIMNNTDLYMCGEDGFLCKVNLFDRSVNYYDIDANKNLYSLHLTESNKLFVGGRNLTILELDKEMGIDDNYLSVNQFTVYPNPAGNFITLSESDTKLYTDYEIYDISGRLLQKSILNSYRIDISTLERGSYYLRLLSPSGIATAGFLKME
ncbi:MAG: T9SS type A sorting domain-containing protein [Candidatus Kapabacteria bacterium]|nr:T9SS type A sorting domain-containing protein [Candidatus Kapabacteria bacterium]